MNKIQLALFASGNGSNAMKILAHFEQHPKIAISLLLTNNPKAGILGKTKGKIRQVVISNEEAKDGVFLNRILQKNNIQYIALAGYLRKIPNDMIQYFPKHILNIHPALLPNYGGKGMYGMNVHQAVFANKEAQSGITIHLVNENYDEGSIIAQFPTEISEEKSPEAIQRKVLKVEHQYFASTIEKYIISQEF